MPGSSRAAQIDLSATPYYHCMGRCVRRAFLCGQDSYSGANYDHRKAWIVQRLKFASEIFAIDVCAFAVLSNHFHTVLRVDAERAVAWTDEAVLRRYARLFPNAARRVRDLPESMRAEQIAILRVRLHDISWFMRVVCEHIARRANREDECTGRFWEGRFKSQALLDNAALYACMSYVDLNPVRAGMSSRLDESAFTSIEQRLREAAAQTKAKPPSPVASIDLVPLRREGRTSNRPALDLRFDDYIELLEWTGRAARAKAGGRIRGAPPELLAQLRIDSDVWLESMTGVEFANLSGIGSEQRLRAEAARRGKRWLKGMRHARALFGAAS